MEESPSQKADRIRYEEVEKTNNHAMQLGKLCMAWAALDGVLDEIIGNLLQCSPAQTACIVNQMDKVGIRCALITRLIYLEDVGDEWRNWFVMVLNRVSEELSPLRNRYVHDQWSIKFDGITRIEKRAV